MQVRRIGKTEVLMYKLWPFTLPLEGKWSQSFFISSMFQSDLMADLRKVSQERDRIAKERKKFKGLGFISLLY